MSFQDVVDEHFPGTMPEADFVQQSYHALEGYGFSGTNAIASVGVCRDEINRSLANLVEDRWGQPFDMSSLAGMLWLGKTGFSAAQHHSPIVEGRERYVYYAMPHIAIGPCGTIGLCHRRGRAEPSSACGALVGFQKELQSGDLSVRTDPYDIEQSLLKQSLFRKIRYGDVPDLVTLTQFTHEIILEDLEKMIELTLDPAKSDYDYAVFTGIQINGPDHVNYVWPSTSYAVVNEVRHEIEW
ncbi:MAG: hypothetical protein ACPGWR_02145 [Ardenticatenaceae bacterium]